MVFKVKLKLYKSNIALQLRFVRVSSIATDHYRTYSMH